MQGPSFSGDEELYAALPVGLWHGQDLHVHMPGRMLSVLRILHTRGATVHERRIICTAQAETLHTVFHSVNTVLEGFTVRLNTRHKWYSGIHAFLVSC